MKKLSVGGWSVPRYFCSTFGQFLILKNTPICERSATEIGERETFQDTPTHTSSFLTQKNLQERKQTSYGDPQWGTFSSSLHSDVSRNTSRNFSTSSSGLPAIQNPRRHHIFSRVINLTSQQGRHNWEILEIFHTPERTPSEP